MILDCVFRLVGGVLRIVGAVADLHKARIEQPLLGLRMRVEQRAQATPDGSERRRLARIDLVDQGE